MNQLTIIGNVGNDPTFHPKTNENGSDIANFDVAVRNPKRNGQEQDPTWFRVTVFNGLAERCVEYLTKGRQVCVTGRVELGRIYTKQNGDQAVDLVVVGNNVEFLGPNPNREANGTAPAPQESKTDSLLASEPQRKAIAALGKETGIDVEAEANALYNTSTGALTRRQASEFIQHLKGVNS